MPCKDDLIIIQPDEGFVRIKCLLLKCILTLGLLLFLMGKHVDVSVFTHGVQASRAFDNLNLSCFYSSGADGFRVSYFLKMQHSMDLAVLLLGRIANLDSDSVLEQGCPNLLAGGPHQISGISNIRLRAGKYST